MKAGPKALPPVAKLPRLRAKTPAGRVEEFARRFLTHVKGPQAGEPLRFETWQQERIIRPLFDTRLPDGRRQYRVCYVTTPRKQGKSTVGAALALYLLYADGEKGGEIISAAADADQAAIVFDIAKSMVEASPALRDMTQIFQRQLVVPATGSRYRVISAEAGTKHGMNLSGAVCDELHVWPSRDLYDVLTTSTGARAQPLIVVLTTAGDDVHSIGAEVHRHAVRVHDGLVPDPGLLPVIYAASPDADPWDEAVWHACNPALGTFRSLEEMRAAARQAQEVPGRELAFRRLYLNQWHAAGASRWLSMPSWDACAELGWAPPQVAGRRVFIGLDLAATTDLTALALLFPSPDGFDVRVEFWCPHENLARRAQVDHVPYPTWAEQGFLHTTEGNSVDYGAIEARIHALMREYDVVEVAVDPWNARQLTTKLLQDSVPVVEVAQTMANLSSASKALETLVLSQRLRHDGHPILRWCVSNAVADTDSNGNLKPSKKRSHERIDGVSALVTALSRALVSQGGSVYDLRAPLLVDL